MSKILVIDDDVDMCLLLKRFLTKNGYEVTLAHNGKKALDELENAEPNLVLCDFRLEDIDGKELLIKIKERYPRTPVIIVTGYSDIKVAVDVMKLGAYDYVTKPLFPDEILLSIKSALQKSSAKQENVATVIMPEDDSKNSTKSKTITSGQYIFSDSPEFKNILKQIDLVSPTNYSILIYGESGSGKEAIAQEIHKRSKRKDMPFVAIDCGALSKELAGSELFGHEKGSFTGALNQKIGNFEIANGGTIFLDEVANLSYDVQVALLRVVQERKMRRIGGNKDIDLDVRIIIASNERLLDAAKKGKFREDLYHRFNEFSIEVPPLRDRKYDMMIFAKHFLKLTNDELSKNIKGFSPEVEAIFKTYVWPGNLRELKNVVKRATLLCDTEYIMPTVLPFEITNFSKLQFGETSEEATSNIQVKQPDPVPATATYTSPVIPEPVFTKQLEINEHSLKGASIDAEYEMIVEALRKANYNKSKAAKILNVDRKTLYNKMKQYKQFNSDL
ncbi:sigma-54 dependent transcriptional regulator [Segetibacter sp.]|jgi:two-component system response regulator HydG|uniref:sigma-54-dependent transcriptional regulator n=1 Tax=Segetibacter sp. TaxID=2231182 RepID=UPI00261584A9|nr:sigma-54 dependent transcriptional regulator [Segetibacter sp.]MCW3078800.1 sigma-54-dependent Fis family transcriptional regulator [Segetibacter sp.]